MSVAALVFVALAGFAAGSVPFAVLVAKHRGLPDPRTYGSGNPGATNVMRSGGKSAARTVFLLDAMKGALATALGYALAGNAGAAVAGVAAVAGHIWSPLLRFKGGRGVATGIGMLVPLDWRLAVAACVTWVALFYMFRLSSVSSVASFIVAAVVGLYLHSAGDPRGVAVAATALLIAARHRNNLAKLAAGKELGFGANQEAGNNHVPSGKDPDEVDAQSPPSEKPEIQCRTGIRDNKLDKRG